MDRRYVALLTHLQTPSRDGALSLEALQSSIAYYLVNPAPPNPKPTPLAAAVIASPLFRPYRYDTCATLRDAFHRATYAKWQALEQQETSLLGRSARSYWTEWIYAVLEGVRGGPVFARLAAVSGLLKGVEDAHRSAPVSVNAAARRRVEDALVSAMKDVFGAASNDTAWAADFRSNEVSDDTRDLAFILSSESLLLVPPERLTTLPLEDLSSQLDMLIASTFRSLLQRAFTQNAADVEPLPSSSHSSSALRSPLEPTTSPTFRSMAVLSKLSAHLVSVQADSRSDYALRTIHATLASLKSLSMDVADQWARSPLAIADSDKAATVQNGDASSTAAWTILKTLLFTTVMISQAALSALAYTLSTARSSDLPDAALRVLSIFLDLSFIISQFGGLAPISGAGFAELTRAAYAALDVLAADGERSARFVEDAVSAVRADAPGPVARARLAFTLACVEQLVPALPAACLQAHVVPLCLQYIGDSADRATFEAAHSVLVAVLADAAAADSNADADAANRTQSKSGLARRLVPFYLECLMENSQDGRLTGDQLRLAFAALVRAAGSTGDAANAPHGALAWYCVDTLLSTLHTLPAESRAQRLRLALVSCLPALPLPLLARALDALRGVVDGMPAGAERKEVADALFAELLERVGDGQKAFAMGWWARHRDGIYAAAAAAASASPA